MAFEYIESKEIEFSETDMAGLVHFSNYFKYMEIAERGFFKSINISLIKSLPNQLTGFPRTRAECKFSAPLRFGDIVKIHLAIKNIKDRSIDFQFRLYKSKNDKNHEEIPVAKGLITTIYTELNKNGELESRELPTELLEKIEIAPDSILNPKKYIKH